MATTPPPFTVEQLAWLQGHLPSTPSTSTPGNPPQVVGGTATTTPQGSGAGGEPSTSTQPANTGVTGTVVHKGVSS